MAWFQDAKLANRGILVILNLRRQLSIVAELHRLCYFVKLQFHYDSEECVEAVVIKHLECPNVLVAKVIQFM